MLLSHEGYRLWVGHSTLMSAFTSTPVVYGDSEIRGGCSERNWPRDESNHTQVIPHIHLAAQHADLDDGLAQEVIRLALEMLLDPRLDVVVLIPHTHLDAVSGVVALAAMMRKRLWRDKKQQKCTLSDSSSCWGYSAEQSGTCNAQFKHKREFKYTHTHKYTLLCACACSLTAIETCGELFFNESK